MDAPRPKASWLRKWWPWLLGLLLLVIVITRVPLDQFRESMQRGPHLQLALVNVAINVAILMTDSFSTWTGLIGLRMRRTLKDVTIVRGATYALFVINYAVGQGGFGYYLHRTGETALRAVGATLFLTGTNLAALILVTLVAWLGYGPRLENPELWWTLVVLSVGFALYLVLIALSPGVIARRQLLAPLFEAGIGGHAFAVITRFPHVAVSVLGQWAALRAWDIPVPLSAGLTLMPAVVIIGALPISIAGLGTVQAAFILFFAQWAPGATADDRAAEVLAFGVVHFVYGLLASLAIGLICLPFARRRGAVPSETDTQRP